ncbi:MAG: lipid-A-disaccharide synthase [Hyphomicrobiales bacterium]|nr:lipid-A-disaccharide synthase [Hyphomicrobiales bacterium]
MAGAAPKHIFMIVGEESGDQLGAELMAALRDMHGNDVRFSGVGGARMEAAGMRSIFPVADITVAGITAVIAHLPRIARRIYQTVGAAIAADPDVVVIIDSPDFTHRVARRIRRRNARIPIIDYVSPSVWAWRPGRARKMAAYVDHVMAILPFEPKVHAELGGPPCNYVGHPLAGRVSDLRPGAGERPALTDVERPTLLVLPGSRRSEVRRLMQPFGEVLGLLRAEGAQFDVVVPAVEHVADEIKERAAMWPVAARIVSGEAAKFAAFRSAHAALAASGTVTLELALSEVPMVVAYRLDPIARRLKWLATVDSIVLANIVLEEKAVPEFVDDDSRPDILAASLRPLLSDTPERRGQLAAFSRLDERMRLEGGEQPSVRAARLVTEVMTRGRDI